MAGTSLTKKVGIAGLGAIGSAVARALTSGNGIEAMTLHAVSETVPKPEFNVPNLSFSELADQCDLIIECLPPHVVPLLTKEALSKNREMVLISSSALLLHPEIMDHLRTSTGRIIVPSGALAGIDAVRALSQVGIKSARIATTKKPAGFSWRALHRQKQYRFIENKIAPEIILRQRVRSGSRLPGQRQCRCHIESRGHRP
jgi:aspartate dehydrogenase